MSLVLWKKKDINVGDQPVTEITILEWKKLFSIKLFHFHKSEGDQDRFHTHSFNSISILLKGNYVEEIIRQGCIHKLNRNRCRVLYIPEHEYHRITKSDGCRTLLITGPWSKYWNELRDVGNDQYQHVMCGSGRVDIITNRELYTVPPFLSGNSNPR
jgi:hypothetical protein